jgi:ankyrin repeat protein
VARAKRYLDDAGRLSLRAKVHVYSQNYTQVRDKIMQASAAHDCNWLEIIPLVQEHEELAANAPTRTGLSDHNDGASLLHVACKAGNRVYAALLLARGAVLEVEDDSGRSPLFYATRAGRTSVVEWLIDEHGMNVNTRDSDGRTPLFYACEEGRTCIAKLLIAKGAEPGIADSVGETPARLAEDNGYEELAAMLREI